MENEQPEKTFITSQNLTQSNMENAPKELKQLKQLIQNGHSTEALRIAKELN